MKKIFGLLLLGLVTVSLALLPPTATAATPIALGVYLPVGGTYGVPIDNYTAMVGQQPAFGWASTTWQDPNGNYVEFNSTYLEVFRTRGILPGVTWEPSKGTANTSNTNQPDFSWKQIIAGKHDAYLTRFAQAAAAYKYPFLLRVLHEMNGNWYPWGYSANGNTTPADSPAAWKHIVDIFRAAGADNVKFVYCVSRNDTGFFKTYGKALKQAYPGDSYVDWIGLDGLNNSETKWRSLQDIFQASYNFFTGFSTRPVMLFEAGTIEKSSDPTAKASWITQGFLTTIPTVFPKVKMVAWFDTLDGQGRDYSVDTSQNSLDAWKQVVADPRYQLPQAQRLP